MLACGSSGTNPETKGNATFRVYDVDGNRIPWNDFRAREQNGAGDNGTADMLVDPKTLVAVATHPLHSSNGDRGDPMFAWPGREVALVSDCVRSSTHARTFLTLYWDLGTADGPHSTFSWAYRNLTAAARSDIDDVGLSLYPDQMPLGTGFTRVWGALAFAFPHAQVWLGELGYRVPETPRPWWWGPPMDASAGRAAVATFYRGAVASGQPHTGGGTYWWLWLEQGASPGPLRAALSSAG